MNKKSKTFEKTVISLFVDQHLQIKDISKQLKCSAYVILRILNDYNINLKLNSISNEDKLFNEILNFYRETQSISKTLEKFSKKINYVYKVFEHENVSINDKTVLDIFVGSRIKNGKSFLFLIKSRILAFLNNMHNKFMICTIDYLKNRYTDSTSIQETIARIFNKIEIRPVCKQCGGELQFQQLTFPFAMFCSRRCSNNNEETKQHLIETCLEKYGTTNTAKAECVKEKTKQHFREKYGVDNPWQSTEVQKQSQQTKHQKYGDENFNNRKKAENTCIDRYGVKNPSQCENIKQKASKKYHITVFNKFGTYWPIQNQDVRLKQVNTMQTKYNATSYLTSNDFKMKCIELYGVENPMHNSELRKKTTTKYMFNDIFFDSAPEIAFYVWLCDNNIPFEYQPNESFDYVFKDSTFKYFPDFKVGDMFFEIKGDHFFKDGKMFCPYRKKSFTDEQYNDLCAKYEAKHQCMLNNNVVILKNAEYMVFLTYVNQKYGKQFLKRFKTCD